MGRNSELPGILALVLALLAGCGSKDDEGPPLNERPGPAKLAKKGGPSNRNKAPDGTPIPKLDPVEFACPEEGCSYWTDELEKCMTHGLTDLHAVHYVCPCGYRAVESGTCAKCGKPLARKVQ